MLRTFALSVARRSTAGALAVSRSSSIAVAKTSKRDINAVCISMRSMGMHTSRPASAAEPETTAVKAPRKKRTTTASTATDATATKTTKKAAPKKTVKAKKPAKSKAKAKAKQAPKRVLNPPKPINSAWVLYFKEQLADMPKEDKKNVTDLSKQLVVNFRSLPAAERSALDERLAKHKEQFEEAMEEYKKTITPEMIVAENMYRRAQKKKTPKRRALPLLRDPTKPVLPMNGFFRFSTKVRNDSALSQEILGVSDAKDIPFGESGRKIADAWRAMDSTAQEPYQAAYEQERAVYDKEIAEWKAKNGPKPTELSAEKEAASAIASA